MWSMITEVIEWGSFVKLYFDVKDVCLILACSLPVDAPSPHRSGKFLDNQIKHKKTQYSWYLW